MYEQFILKVYYFKLRLDRGDILEPTIVLNIKPNLKDPLILIFLLKDSGVGSKQDSIKMKLDDKSRFEQNCLKRLT